jgi:hypothetical protein
MTISYRTPGSWGAGLGRDLHPAEVDTNFYELKGLIDSIQTALPGTTVSIMDITQTGDNLFVTLTDDSVLGPFKMPILNLVFRGEWVPATAYYVSDVVTFNGSVYLVLFAHTSLATFNPGENDGSGHDYYGIILSTPGGTLPPEGTAGQVLIKSTDTDFDIEWASAGVPVGGTTGQVLAKTSDTDYDADWSDPEVAAGIPAGGALDATLTKVSATDFDMTWVVRGQSATVATSTYTLVLADFYKWLRCTNAGGCVVTIPTNAAVAFLVDTEVTIRAATAGAVSIAAASGVTLNVPTGFTATLLGNGATVLIKKVATNTWDLAGLLAPA